MNKSIAIGIALLLIATLTGAETPAVSGPMSLEEAVQTALKHSPMIQSAGYQASAAQARVGMARAMTRPQLSVTGIAGKSQMGDILASPPNIMPQGLTTFPGQSATTGQAVLMFPIYSGGRLSAVVNGAEALSSAAGSDRAAVERNVSAEAKTAYHGALLADASVDVYENLVKEEVERVRIAQAAFDEGKIAKFDLLRNQADLANAQQQLENAKRDTQVAMVDLKAILGINQVSEITLSDKLEHAAVTDDMDTLLKRAAESRPELASTRARVTSARASVDAAKGLYKPQVYVNAMQGVTAASGDSESGYTLGVSVGLNLVDGGLRKSGVKEAESMVKAMESEEQQTRLAVEQDVRTAWAEVEAADRNVQLSRAAVTQAEENYRVVRLRYEAGKTINVEVLDALFSLVRAQTNELSALYDHNIARDRLARAVGEI